MARDLTSASYWDRRQSLLQPPKDFGAITDLLDSIEPFLQPFEGQRWIELGCSPGHMSTLLYRRIPFVPFGVDFSLQAYLYVETMACAGNVEATLFQTDIRQFVSHEPFDVVMSFGLIEHFSDPQDILEHHHRICRKDGLIIVSIPHFRYFQWLYHYLFDRTDLARHNVDMMQLQTFRTFADRRKLDTLFLGHVGKMYFWNVDETGSRLVVVVRKLVSLFIRGFANYFLSKILPPNKKLYSPWVLFIAKRT